MYLVSRGRGYILMYEGIEIFEIFWNSLILLNIGGGGGGARDNESNKINCMIYSIKIIL